MRRLFCSLAAVALLASPALADLKFEWDAPTARVNGAPLDPNTELARYKFWRDGLVRANIMAPAVGTAPPTNYTYTTNLGPGTYKFLVTAVDKAGIESAGSNIVTVVVTATPTPVMTPTHTPTAIPQPKAPELFRLEGHDATP